MELKIDQVFISAEPLRRKGNGIDEEGADVIVLFDNGDTYAASFFTYDDISRSKLKNQHSGKFLNGKYFWAERMVVIENFKREDIEQVIEDLMTNGDFFSAFRKL